MRIESHCDGCPVCGPEWRTLLRLEEMMAEVPAPPAGFADRVMAGLPATVAPRREAMPFVIAGLLAAGALLAFRLAFVSDWAAPWLAPVQEALSGIADVARTRAAETPWTMSGWIAGAAAIAGAVAGAALFRVRHETN